jgi:hypothetical protein
LQGGGLDRVNVEADDLDAGAGKMQGQRQANVAQSNYGDFHQGNGDATTVCRER